MDPFSLFSVTNARPSTIAFFILLAIWTLYWKGMALWRSAQLGHRPWFIIILLVNLFGLIEIFYLYVIAPRAESTKGTTEPTT